MTLPISNRTVVSHQVNLDQELEKAGIDYLYVVSRPETTVAAGKHFRYQLETRSENGGVRYRIEAGPRGMRVSDKGLVTRRASRSDGGKQHNVIVSIEDRKVQKVTHTFKVAVE